MQVPAATVENLPDDGLFQLDEPVAGLVVGIGPGARPSAMVTGGCRSCRRTDSSRAWISVSRAWVKSGRIRRRRLRGARLTPSNCQVRQRVLVDRGGLHAVCASALTLGRLPQISAKRTGDTHDTLISQVLAMAALWACSLFRELPDFGSFPRSRRCSRLPGCLASQNNTESLIGVYARVGVRKPPRKQPIVVQGRDPALP